MSDWRAIARSSPASSGRRPSHLLIDVGAGYVRVLDVERGELLSPRPLEDEARKGAWFRLEGPVPDLDEMLAGAVDLMATPIEAPAPARQRWSVDVDGAPARGERPVLSGLSSLIERGRWVEVVAAGPTSTPLVVALFDGWTRQPGAAPVKGVVEVLLEEGMKEAVDDLRRQLPCAVAAVGGPPDRPVIERAASDVVVIGGTSPKHLPDDVWSGRAGTIVVDAEGGSAVDVLEALSQPEDTTVIAAANEEGRDHGLVCLAPTLPAHDHWFATSLAVCEDAVDAGTIRRAQAVRLLVAQVVAMRLPRTHVAKLRNARGRKDGLIDEVLVELPLVASGF